MKKEYTLWKLVLSILVFLIAIALSIGTQNNGELLIHTLLPAVKVGKASIYYASFILYGLYFLAVTLWFNAFEKETHKVKTSYKLITALGLLFVFSSAFKIDL